jgi:hypothetical protein
MTARSPPDFSLVLGGPLYQLLRRARLSGDALQLLRRRIGMFALVSWLPLLALAVLEGHAWGGTIKVPFLLDVEIHLRLLLALPLFIVAELVVNARSRPVVQQFVERGLIPEAIRPKFDAAIESAMRLRNSVVAELSLIALVYLVGVMFIWRTQAALPVDGWYGVWTHGRLQPSLAGWWFGLVSLPLFQFILLRWYFRIAIWARFLWQVSRMGLSLMPTHPDRCGGLGFLGSVTYAFAPLLVGQGVVLSGMIANRIFFEGEKLLQFRVEIVGVVLLLLFVVLGPLLVFAPVLAEAKRVGLREYGVLAQRYAREFDQKWLRAGAPPEDPLMGSADIQSLADMGNSFEVIREMKLLPFTRDTVIQLGFLTLLPVLPLVLTMISLADLVDRMLKVLF